MPPALSPTDPPVERLDPPASAPPRSSWRNNGLTAVGITAVTFAVFVGGYALSFGWGFAVGFALLLLIHEMGHVIQLRREGVRASAPVFIPFLGAMVAMKDMPRNAYVEAKVGLAGPILGTAASFVVLAVAAHTDSDLLRAVAYTGFFLNLFNLIPVVPLDGGRAVGALSPVMWFGGAFVVALLAFRYRSPIMFAILALVAYEVYVRWNNRSSAANVAYNAIRRSQRVAVFVTYIGLVLVLVWGLSLRS
jgi:Zn-dependent protease